MGDRTLRAANSDFKIFIGGFGTHGRLLPVQKSRKNDGKGGGSYKRLTPNDQLAQMVWTDDTEEIFQQDELGKGMINEDGEVVRLNAEAIEQARTSELDKGVLNIEVYSPSKFARENLWPDPATKSFIFIPMITKNRTLIPASTSELMVYEMLCSAAAKKDILIGSAVVGRGKENLYRLRVWRGHLVLQAMAYTNFLEDHEIRKPNITKEQKKVMASLVKKMAKDFNSEDLADNSIDRIRAAEAIKFGEDMTDVLLTAETNDDDDSDLLAAFSAAVEAM